MYCEFLISNTSTTAFVRAVLLTNFIGEVINRRDLIRGINDLDYLEALRGLRVEVAHRGEVCRKYPIAGLTKQSNRDLGFELSTDETKTVMEYFRETYKLQLGYDFLHCLQVGTEKKPSYLPMEICANGGQVAAMVVCSTKLRESKGCYPCWFRSLHC